MPHHIHRLFTSLAQPLHIWEKAGKHVFCF
uniref:Uncharacterized protein n=1 Tax=Anguilla anguilla TaxID=7936 RepID=A0A0E9RSJ6_ANGAN